MQDQPAPAVETVLRATREALATFALRRQPATGSTRVAVALSGGRDSIVLLDALALVATGFDIALSAVHVHHGLSVNADAWAKFCADECERRALPFAVYRVRVERAGGASLEATARAARYAALATVDADIVALAHHADDQAETLLLQMLRGAGPHGLAAMPQRHSPPDGPALVCSPRTAPGAAPPRGRAPGNVPPCSTSSLPPEGATAPLGRPGGRGGGPAVLFRPLLGLPRAAIDAYASARALAWVEDESNTNTGLKRNFIRHEIATRLVTAFPGYPATLVRAARHQAEAALLIDELAALDAQEAMSNDVKGDATLDRTLLIALAERAPHRARNLLRWFLRQQGLAAPSTARLAAMLEQLTLAATDARVRLAHDGSEVGIHRGRIVVHPPTIGPIAIAWQGEAELALPHGTLEFASCVGAGVDQAALHAAPVVVRTRAGGERIRLSVDRPMQALKHLLQNAGMPLWQRESLPLVFCGSSLAAVPGIGVDAAFQASADTPGYRLQWRPRARHT